MVFKTVVTLSNISKVLKNRNYIKNFHEVFFGNITFKRKMFRIENDLSCSWNVWNRVFVFVLQVSVGKLTLQTNNLIKMIHKQPKTVTEISPSELKTIHEFTFLVPVCRICCCCYVMEKFRAKYHAFPFILVEILI